MQAQIKLWTVDDGKLVKLPECSFSNEHKERDLESWVESDPSLLGGQLIVVGRQVYIPQVGPLDILGVDQNGRLVVIEFKRHQTTRDTIAQILDYASAIRRMDIDQLSKLSNINAEELSEIKNFDPSMILVAEEADESAERIVEYLASKAQLAIEVVTFTYSKLADGREIIARSILIPETSPSNEEAAVQTTLSDIFRVALDRKVLPFVETLRKVVNLDWREQVLQTNGGTIRYWIASPDGKGRVLFGINVGGEKANSPVGALDIWCWPEIVAEYSGLPEESTREQLKRFKVLRETSHRIFFRIDDQISASKFYDLLEKWDSTSAEFKAKREAEVAALQS